jgi:hypothetical protein
MGGGVGEAMLIGAAMGGGSAAMTGGDPLKGALLGAAGGGFGAGIAGAQAGGAAGAVPRAFAIWRLVKPDQASGAAGSATALPSALQHKLPSLGPSMSHIFSRTSNWTSWNTGGIQPHVP